MSDSHFGEEFKPLTVVEHPIKHLVGGTVWCPIDTPPSPPTTLTTSIEYKYDEKESLKELQTYIDKTYSEHYSNNNIQTMEYLLSIGQDEGFLIGSIIKYAARYGKKDGYNRKDIMKILHYATILLYAHDKNHE